MLAFVYPIAFYQQFVMFFDAALFHEVVHTHECFACLGNHNCAARFLIEAMTQFKHRLFRTGSAKAFNQSI